MYILQRFERKCISTRVARWGRQSPVGLLLTAVGALIFDFGTLTATFGATFQITEDHFGMEFSRFGDTFCRCVAAAITSEKSGSPDIDNKIRVRENVRRVRPESAEVKLA